MTGFSDFVRGPDGFLEMEAFDDVDLAPTEAADLERALAVADPTDLDDATWTELVERAVDPAAPAVDDAVVGVDDPFADVGDDDGAGPFGVDRPVTGPAPTDTADTDEDNLADDGGGSTDEGDGAVADDHTGADGPDPDDGFDGALDLTEPGDGLLDELADEPAGGDLDPASVDDVDGLDALDSHLRDHGL